MNHTKDPVVLQCPTISWGEAGLMHIPGEYQKLS